MAVTAFDTLKFANTLKASGMPDKVAAAQAQLFAEALQVNFKELGTKEDLAATSKDLKREIAEVQRELSELRDELKRDFREEFSKFSAKVDLRLAKQDGEIALLRWMFGVTVGGILAIFTLVLRSQLLHIP